MSCAGFGCSHPDTNVPVADSLQADIRTVRSAHLPVVIFVSRDGCEYCAVLRERILEPMMRKNAFDGVALLREVSLDPGTRLIDFSGRSVSGQGFAERYDATLTPTLLFLDDEGREVAQRLVGISNVEYYGYYLDKALVKARSALLGTVH